MKIQYKKLSLAALFALTALMPNMASAMRRGGGSDDNPLAGLPYRDAFDQTDIFKQFRDLMEHWGCKDNVLPNETESACAKKAPRKLCSSDGISCCVSIPTLEEAILRQRHGGYEPVAQIESEEPDSAQNKKNDEAFWKKRQQEFENACLKRLKNNRRLTIGRPGINAIIITSLLVTASIGVNKILTTMKGPQCAGDAGGFAIANAVFNGLFNAAEGLGVLYFLWKTPPHALDDLEKEYAKNQCFIPRELWPLIIEKFVTARSTPYEQAECISFIKFVLRLKEFAPQEPITMQLNDIEQPADAKVVSNEILRRTAEFFKDYDIAAEELDAIELSIEKFIKQLVNGGSDSAPYLYLVGPYGLGKTEFVNSLQTWLNELLPSSVYYEEFKASSPAELAGDRDNAGLFLNALSKQLDTHKRGTLIFMDEATWFNKPDMASDVKRELNGNFSKVSTLYFGGGVGGQGLSFNLPPMLMFIASNELIADLPLKSRFYTITFPKPSATALANHAARVFKHSTAGKTTARASDALPLSTLYLRAGQQAARIEEQIKNAVLTIIDQQAMPGARESTLPKDVAQAADAVLKAMDCKTIDNFRDADQFADRLAWRLIKNGHALPI